MYREIYIKRDILGISLIYKAKLERTLIGYLIKTFIKGGRRQPVKLNNKNGKYLISNSLGVCHGAEAVAIEHIYSRSLQDVARSIVRVEGVRRVIYLRVADVSCT